MQQAIPEILLVEDSAADVLMTREALENTKILNHLNVVEDGVEAMAFLRHSGQYASMPKPNLIILDLNLPRKTGHQVLAEIKNDPVLKLIPVVVLTTSEAEADVLRAYDQHANCYISKPVDFENFATVIRSIEKFWCSIVTLPEHAA